MQQCTTHPPLYTNHYTSNPAYGVGPHITVRKLYDPRISNIPNIPIQHQQYLPESVLNGDTAAPVTTEWLLRDHINSLKGFISYYATVGSANGGAELQEVAVRLNNSILPLLNFNVRERREGREGKGKHYGEREKMLNRSVLQCLYMYCKTVIVNNWNIFFILL